MSTYIQATTQILSDFVKIQQVRSHNVIRYRLVLKIFIVHIEFV